MIWNWAEKRYIGVVSAGFYKLYIEQCNCATELTLTDTVNFNRAYHRGGWGHAKLTKVGMQMFCFNPQISQIQILGCIPLLQSFLDGPVCKSQIQHKLLRCASPLIANPQMFYIEDDPFSGLFGEIFYLKFEPENFKPILIRREIMYFQIWESFKSGKTYCVRKLQKMIVSVKSAKFATFVEGSLT